MVVLDNQSSITSGDQSHSGTGRDAFGQTAPRLNPERIASACGLDDVRTISLDDRPALRKALQDAWLREEPGLVVIEIPSIQSAQR